MIKNELKKVIKNNYIISYAIFKKNIEYVR